MISTAVYWSKYKDPYPDIMQRVRDFGTLSHKQDVSIIFPFSEIRNSRGRSVKNRNDGRHQKKKNTKKNKTLLNNIIQHYQSSYELTETEAACTGPAQVCTSHLHICYGSQFSFLMRFLSANE